MSQSWSASTMTESTCYLSAEFFCHKITNASIVNCDTLASSTKQSIPNHSSLTYISLGINVTITILRIKHFNFGDRAPMLPVRRHHHTALFSRIVVWLSGKPCLDIHGHICSIFPPVPSTAGLVTPYHQVPLPAINSTGHEVLLLVCQENVRIFTLTVSFKS